MSHVPKVVSFCYKDYESTTSKRTAKCTLCGIKVVDGPATTSKMTCDLTWLGTIQILTRLDLTWKKLTGDLTWLGKIWPVTWLDLTWREKWMTCDLTWLADKWLATWLDLKKSDLTTTLIYTNDYLLVDACCVYSTKYINNRYYQVSSVVITID